MYSYRVSDNALAWSGNMDCGSNAGGFGINCYYVLSGTTSGGGSGCSINMGSAVSAAWHTIYMGETNTDTYVYMCNGAQHSSGHNMNHRYWFRRARPVPAAQTGDGTTQATSGNSCQAIKASYPLSPDGPYWIDPNGGSTSDAVQAICDMTRQGGGWMLGLKHWNGSVTGGVAGALGALNTANYIRNNTYKLADSVVRDVIA
jgi:hypothetical protein